MLIGIDTGGTYTDAVLFDETALDNNLSDNTTAHNRGDLGVLAWAKTRTRTDLTLGIREALNQLAPDPDEISLVSLSTTLATNALVEGVGGRVGLVLIGFDDEALQRAGLAEALGKDPVIKVDGGHDSYGVEAAPLDLTALEAAVADLDVDSFAVAAHFSVRNPDHELAARDFLATTGRPVACSHELSARLNGPKRALTCLLNARLLPLITDLCAAARLIMSELSIDAPLMLVRGDGSLVSADFALARPIETILSGPAASLVGAGYLRGSDELSTSGTTAGTGNTVMVSDIGGTTTDIGLVVDGRPSINPDGAVVGGHHTMVEAVDMFTVGLGGDSEIHINRSVPASLRLGPRRVTPVSLAAMDDPDTVKRAMAARRAPFREEHVQFVRPTGRTGATSKRDERLLQKMTDRSEANGAIWHPFDEIVTSSMENSAVWSLVRTGLAQIAGFTPSDASHVLGYQETWDHDAALTAANIMASIGDNRGDPLGENPQAFCQWVVDQLIHQSAEAVLAVALEADGIGADSVTHPLVQRALADPPTLARVTVGSQIDVVGLGASAATYYPAVAKKVGTNGIIPPYAQVANAVGAVVGQVRIAAQCTISQPSKGKFRIHWPGVDDRADQQPAIDDAIAALTKHVNTQAEEAGADEVSISNRVELKTANIEGKEVLVEGLVEVVAVGRPKFAGS